MKYINYNEKHLLLYITIIKKLIFIIFIFFFCIINNYNLISIKYNYLFQKKNNFNKIRLGIFTNSLKNGGTERQTSLLLNYFNKIKIFELFLFTRKEKEKNEYIIDKNIPRFIIKKNLTEILIRQKINILIYQTYNINEINELNKLKNIKTIFINRSCFLHWIYYKFYSFYKIVYNAYKNSKYIISLIKFENDYLFKKWGINSILMNNFIPFDYNKVIPSDLSSKTILMIGRGSDKIKRFNLGIKSMKYIINEIPECEMKIISELSGIVDLKNLIKNLNLQNSIKFVGYKSNPQTYYKNASLHIFPTLVEAFPNVLSETLTYGIPNILIGLDYISASKGGTIIIYEDSPISLAKIAIKILTNYRYRKYLGKEARKNIKKFNNQMLLNKWIKLILSIYKGEKYYEKLRNKEKKIKEEEALKIMENQIKLLKSREKRFENITINDIENFTFMENLK